MLDSGQPHFQLEQVGSCFPKVKGMSGFEKGRDLDERLDELEFKGESRFEVGVFRGAEG